MSLTPTTALASVVARPRVSWSVPSASDISRVHVSRTPMSPMLAVDAHALCFEGYTGTNHNGTTGSKRPHPGHLDEVST
jgi:hypothetical protein